MKREYFSTLALVGCMVGLMMLRDYRGEAAAALAVGSPAPAYLLQDAKGITHSSTELKGQYVLLNFWASWCAPCKAEIPDLNRIHRSSTNPKVQVIGIILDSGSAPEVSRAASRFGVQYPTLLGDQRTMEAYNVISLPTSVLLAPNGAVITTFYGPIHEALIQETLAQAQPPP